jgi:cellulose synthase/poly-beta-1,6-N-acetylglucosamine synthase-like glycosyltransferase
MDLIKIFFWLFIFIVFYSYIGYGLLLWVLLKLRKLNSQKNLPISSKEFEPRVSLVIATFNEEDVIAQKIDNCLALDYPADKLKIYFVADGSTDATTEIIGKHPSVELLFEPVRAGKVAAINRAMQFVSTDFVVFCDANTMLNKEAIREIIKHYQDPIVGAVAGEKKVIAGEEKADAAGAGESFYWKYESTLKKMDSDFHTVVGAAGELFSVRRALYEHVGSNVLLDDFIISMNICKKGYKVVYEPAAFATEPPSFSIKEEQKRKIRISAGGFQSVWMLRSLLNIFKYGRLSFQYISHRVLRWVVCPILLPTILILNVIIVIDTNITLYQLLLLGQLIFYAAAAGGAYYASKNIKVKALYIPYYFVFMNTAMYLGFRRFVSNSQTVLWDKAKRKQP